jgi:hypothetical protein
VSAGAEAAGRLLAEAHQALREMESPAKHVTAALRMAHHANPSTGVRTLLLPDEQSGGAR